MSLFRSFLKLFKLLILENIYTRKLIIKNDNAIFSFTFDDVPISAFTNGATILENANATGTFYVALGMGANDGTRRYFNETEILPLHHRGHDIGCHTFSHLNLRQSKTKDVVLDCEKNVNGLLEILDIESIDNFAYPFGMVSPLGKKNLKSKYKTLRTTDYGLNVGLTDLTHLRAVNLYADSFDRYKIEKLITEAVKTKAWVIFYTHDIRDNPSKWGTKPNDLKWVVELCLASGGEILNIKEAIKKISC